MSALSVWGNFFVIVGSSAGALTGLTFVVISLTTGSRLPNNTWGVSTYTTPTVVHFGAVLFVAAAFSAPWPTLTSAAVMLGLCGLAGLGYTITVVRRLPRGGEAYTPVLEDWLAHAVSPLVAYMVFVVAAVLLPGNPVPALFGVGAALLLLMFTGIHNAWDVVTFMLIYRRRQEPSSASDETAETAEAAESSATQAAVEREETADGAWSGARAVSDETVDVAQQEP